MRITDVQSFSLHDGPGIRTVIFLAGCPLSCPWCHNPEAREGAPRLILDSARCIGCMACRAACPHGAHELRDGGHFLHRGRCHADGACVAACPTGALALSQRELTEEELLALAEREARLGGAEGGLTFSGGEPLLQGEALLSVLPRLGVSTAIETSGYADEDLFCRVVEAVDYVMMDLKLFDGGMHRRYTGVSNLPILRNLAHLRESGKPFLLRTPLIPGITDTEENLAALATLVGEDPWERLPYNSAAAQKHERLGLPYSLTPDIP